jgi:hypothetical protein
VAAEPAEELLGAMAHEQQADHDPEYEKSEFHLGSPPGKC